MLLFIVLLFHFVNGVAGVKTATPFLCPVGHIREFFYLFSEFFYPPKQLIYCRITIYL